jgi:hypothetical protein
MMARLLIVAPLVLILSGCGYAAKIDARNDYQQSTAIYRACVTSALNAKVPA